MFLVEKNKHFLLNITLKDYEYKIHNIKKSLIEVKIK